MQSLGLSYEALEKIAELEKEVWLKGYEVNIRMMYCAFYEQYDFCYGRPKTLEDSKKRNDWIFNQIDETIEAKLKWN